jgi:hypothetical protein
MKPYELKININMLFHYFLFYLSVSWQVPLWAVHLMGASTQKLDK